MSISRFLSIFLVTLMGVTSTMTSFAYDPKEYVLSSPYYWVPHSLYHDREMDLFNHALTASMNKSQISARWENWAKSWHLGEEPHLIFTLILSGQEISTITKTFANKNDCKIFARILNGARVEAQDVHVVARCHREAVEMSERYTLNIIATPIGEDHPLRLAAIEPSRDLRIKNDFTFPQMNFRGTRMEFILQATVVPDAFVNGEIEVVRDFHQQYGVDLRRTAVTYFQDRKPKLRGASRSRDVQNVDLLDPSHPYCSVSYFINSRLDMGTGFLVGGRIPLESVSYSETFSNLDDGRRRMEEVSVSSGRNNFYMGGVSSKSTMLNNYYGNISEITCFGTDHRPTLGEARQAFGLGNAEFYYPTFGLERLLDQSAGIDLSAPF